MHILSIIILGIVLLGIASRKLGRLHIPIWTMMLAGAVAVLLTGQISFVAAAKAIDFNIICYLFGVFVLGQALESSGYLQFLCRHLFAGAHRPKVLLLMVVFAFGLSSAVLMNDTIAIMATPVLLLIAAGNQTAAKPLLLALAFAITIGSVMSPIGNPQNLLIAIKGGLRQPFIEYLRYLFIPTIINLTIAYCFILLRYRKKLIATPATIKPTLYTITHSRLSRLAQMGLIIMLLLIMLKIAMIHFHESFNLRFSWIGLAAGAPILLFAKERIMLLKKLDWGTLIFFVAMFVLMQSVWDSQVLQSLMNQAHLNLTTTPSIFGISVILSQLISKLL